MKVFIVAAVFTSFHLLEDLIWLTVGRYTDIPYRYFLVIIVLLGILSAIVVRHPKVKRFLGH